MIPFDNTYARLPDVFHTRLDPTPVKAPALIHYNDTLAAELGINVPEAERAALFSGNSVPDGADPLAQVYAGHQFGGFSPRLGDGRANLLGEVVDRQGRRRDIQLKGSGPTPYSRMGDGRAWLGPVLREYVVSEAMQALGIPTSRALAAVSTGERVFRETGAHPGAILTRVAASHLRVGTFQYFAAQQDRGALQQLFDYTVARHYPSISSPDALLQAVIDRQAQLVAKWMGVGFIHGVMNTDNTTISGETIDYGPCAFMDVFHPQTVFSSIDAQGRYGYDNQPRVLVWNMAQLATALVPLMPDQDKAVETFTRSVQAMPAKIGKAWLDVFGAKIGLAAPEAKDETLITDLLQIMLEGRADFTNTFRALSEGGARDQFLDPTVFDAWEARWQARVTQENCAEPRMRAANPAVIPRNHRIEQMIAAAVEGDYKPFERLLAALAQPFEIEAAAQDLARPPATSEIVQRTFCGT